MAAHIGVAPVGLGEAAGQMDRVKLGVIHRHHAARLEQFVDEDQIDEGAIEAMVTVDKGEIKLAALLDQFWQEDL